MPSLPGSQDLPQLATRLQALLSTIQRPSGRRWSYAALADECTRRGTPVSNKALHHYATGVRSAPSARLVFQLAEILEVDPTYFWSTPDTTVEEVSARWMAR